VEFYEDGTPKSRKWHRYGMRHRDDGPAVEEFYEDGTPKAHAWYREGNRHRGDDWVVDELHDEVTAEGRERHGELTVSRVVGWPAADLLRGHTSSVEAVTGFTASDGRVLLASGSRDHTVRVWDPATGRQIGGLLGVRTAVTAVTAFTPGEGRVLLATAHGIWGGGAGEVRVWPLEFVLRRHRDGRDDGPALSSYRPDGTIEKEWWFRDGKQHRENGPAVESFHNDGSPKAMR